MSISSLESELSRQKQINRELRQELSEVESGVNSGYRALEACNDNICNTLNSSYRLLEDSHSKGIAAIELQGEIDKMYVRFKQMELANKRIRECNNKKYYEFANYRTVRKLVQGMMDNLDVNMVSDGVIYKSVEKQHLKTPDYWLTCVLISIMAWKNDDRELAERAINIALGLDKKNSAVFYMLFNLRMKRNDAALKWFLVYQECSQKGSDQRTFLLLFTMVSKTLNESESVDVQMREQVIRFIQDVLRMNQEAEDYDESALVHNVKSCYGRMSAREELAYPLLKKHCQKFSVLATALNRAKGNVNILAFLKQIIHLDNPQRNAFISNYVDELIGQANQMEKEVYDTIRYNEMIIRYQGEVELAKQKFEEEQLHDESSLNLMAEMIRWIFESDQEEVSAQSRQSMFILSKEIQRKALEEYIAEYRAIDKMHLPVKIGEYEAQMNFSDLSGEEQKVERYYQKKRDDAYAAIKSWPAYVGFGVAALAAVASFFTSFAMLVITVIGLGYGAVTLLGNNIKKKEIALKCSNDNAAVADQLRCLFEEHRAYLEEWSRFDAYVAEITQEMDQI